MYAVINAGGKQERVEVGELVDVELLAAAPGDELTLVPLLVVDGDDVVTAADALAAAPVRATVIGEVKGPKSSASGLRLRGVLRGTLLAGLVIVPLVLLLAAPLHPHPVPQQAPPAQPPAPTVTPRVSQVPHPSAGFRLPLAGVLYALLILALIAGIVVCVVLMRRPA